MFQEGFTWSEMKVTRLGGMLFGEGTAPLLDAPDLVWSERAAVALLDQLLWTPRGKKGERQRVHYGPLYVEDLGRVYEALLELSPGIATEPMCRLRRQKLEVVVPLAQGEAYRKDSPSPADKEAAESDEEAESDDDEEKPVQGKTRVEWIEEILAGKFYLRVGLGRKASGSYYTPQAFVKFLIQETLGPQIEARSPHDNPDPNALLGLKVLDPAMGSGHFLVEACRTLGEALYEACRACDGKAEQAARRAEGAQTAEEKAKWVAEAAMWRKRVVDVPDPNDELVAYLPSRATEGEEEGRSQSKALAICRRLAAVHCLYGVDKNELAVELAKLSLWLESYAEGLPLTFLDHRLLCRDSLTGPFFEKLLTLPSKDGGALEDLYSRGVSDRLTETLGKALVHVRALEASIGKDAADIEHKRAAKEKLDAALRPFRLLSAAWSGAVMLGERLEDDYRALALVVAHGGDVEGVIAERPGLAKAVEVGEEGVSYDLEFPEVFWPEGKYSKGGRQGSHAVVGTRRGTLQPLAKEFYAAYDLRILDAPTRMERAAVEKRLTVNPEVAASFKSYVRGFDSIKLLLDRTYQHVNRLLHGGSSGAVTDLWQPFAERGATALAHHGRLGMVLPSAFHANQSATGIRDLFLNSLTLTNCFSFENAKKLFEIHSSFKFALVTACRDDGATTDFSCAFYLHDLEWLFGSREALSYDRRFVEQTGGGYLSFLELRSALDAGVARAAYLGAEPVGSVRERTVIRFGEEMHMSKASHLFTPIDRVGDAHSDPRSPEVASRLLADGYLPLHEGKTFHQYDDRWEARPRYLVALSAIADKPAWRRVSQFFRLAFRDIASSTNERTGIFCMLPPGVLCGNKAPCEREPFSRRTVDSLSLLAMANSFSFDYVLRFKVQATVNLFILDSCPVPPSIFTLPRSLFLAHSALRLSCNHEGYLPLWKEQLGEDTWREPDLPAHLPRPRGRRRTLGCPCRDRRRRGRSLRPLARPVFPRPLLVQPQELPRRPRSLPRRLRRALRDGPRSLHPQTRPLRRHPPRRDPPQTRPRPPRLPCSHPRLP
ncbi:MAG: N-6 DNA methylase [Polyangiaceae bacterium]